MTVFWGISVKSGNPVTVNFRNAPRKRLRVTQATMRDRLDLPSGDIEPNTELHCKVGDQQPHTICSLGKHAYMWKFDLEFEGPDEVEFSVSGPRVIDVAGYFFEDARPINIMFSQIDAPTQREVVTPGEQSVVLLGLRNDHQKEAIDSTYKEKQGSCVEHVPIDISELDRVITSIGRRVMADEFGGYGPILGSLRLARDDELAAEFMKAKDRLCFGSGSMGSELSCLPATALELVRNPDVGLANSNVAVMCANKMIQQSAVTRQKLVDTVTDSVLSGGQTTSAIEESSKITASKACEDSLTINACVDCEHDHDHDSDKEMVHGLSKDTGAELSKQEKLTPADEVTMQSEGVSYALDMASFKHNTSQLSDKEPETHMDGDNGADRDDLSVLPEENMPKPKKNKTKRAEVKLVNREEKVVTYCANQEGEIIQLEDPVDEDNAVEPNKFSVLPQDSMQKPKKKKAKRANVKLASSESEKVNHKDKAEPVDQNNALEPDNVSVVLEDEMLMPKENKRKRTKVKLTSIEGEEANCEDKVVTSCSNESTEIIHKRPQVDRDDCVEPNHVSMVVEDQMPKPRKKRKRTKKSSNVEGSMESEMHEQTVLIDRHDDCVEPNKSVIMEDQMLKPKKKMTISKESSSIPGSKELSCDTIQACNQQSEAQMVEHAIPVDKDEPNVSVAVENQMLKPKKKKKKAKESSCVPDSMELSCDSFHACNQQNETEMAKQAIPVENVRDTPNLRVAVEDQMLKPKKKRKKAKDRSSVQGGMELSCDTIYACNQRSETEMVEQAIPVDKDEPNVSVVVEDQMLKPKKKKKKAKDSSSVRGSMQCNETEMVEQAIPVDKDDPNVSVLMEDQMLKPKKKKKKAKDSSSIPGSMQCSETEMVEQAIPVDKDEPNVSVVVEDQMLKPKKKKKKAKDSSSVRGSMQCNETEMVEQAIPVDKDDPNVSVVMEDQMLKPKKKKKKAKDSSSIPGSMQCSETEMVEQAIPVDKDEPNVSVVVDEQMLKPKKKKKKAKDSSSVPGSMQCSETEMVEQAIPVDKDEPNMSVVVEDQMLKPKKKKKKIKESSSVLGSMQCCETEMVEQAIPVDMDDCVEPSNFPLVVEDQIPKPMKKRIRTKKRSSVGGSIENEMNDQTIVERDVCVEPNVSVVVEDEMLEPKKKERKTKESSSVGGGVELSDDANHALACNQRSDSEMVEQANPIDRNSDVDLAKKQDPVSAGHMIVCALTVQPFSIQPPSATPVRQSPIRRSTRSSTK